MDPLANEISATPPPVAETAARWNVLGSNTLTGNKVASAVRFRGRWDAIAEERENEYLLRRAAWRTMQAGCESGEHLFPVEGAMRTSFVCSALNRVWIVVFILVWTPCALAVNPAEWQIVQEIQRTDVTQTWTSPTAVDLDAAAWEWDLEITKVTATVNVPFNPPYTEDITDSFSEDFRVRSGVADALPAVLVDDVLLEPESGTSIDLLIDIDGAGVGRALFSDIALGSVNVPLFGSQPIVRVNFEALLNVTSVVPEPGLAGVLGVLCLGLRRRR